MQIWIDGDGCPVLQLGIEIAASKNISVTVVKNFAVEVHSDYARVITVDTSRDAADLYIVNHLEKGDIVISQDYGLCGMALSKLAYCINQNGQRISQDNIDLILDRRHTAKVQRQKNRQYTRNRKRRPEDNQQFIEGMYRLFEEIGID